MPLTGKGSEIMQNMKETYGAEKGKHVFYATKNAGKISGVDRGKKDAYGMTAPKNPTTEWINTSKRPALFGKENMVPIESKAGQKAARGDCQQTKYLDACGKGDAKGIKSGAAALLRGRVVR